MSICKVCNKLTKQAINKYCSNKCEATDRYNIYIHSWKRGDVTGDRGIVAKNISAHIKRYLLEKYGESCVLCGWEERHALTGKVPLEIDHVNGNSNDNRESNLRLLCPNCHSLSHTYRNLNKGNGRSWRLAKYLKTH